MQLLEFLPILVFVVTYYFSDIFWATASLMAAVAIQIAIIALARKPISAQLKITFWLTLAFGTLTLAFQDKTFIQWKPTIINWLLAAALIGSQYFGTNLIQRLLGKQLTLPATAWRRLNGGWALGFFVAGALNLIVAYNFSEAFWVSYKLIGGFAITLIYILITAAYLAYGGHLRDPESDAKRSEAGGAP
jgi:intracellular septation protein